MKKPFIYFLIAWISVAMIPGFGRSFSQVAVANTRYIPPVLGSQTNPIDQNPVFQPADRYLRILEINDQGVILELTTPFPQVSEIKIASGACQELNIEGYTTSGEPGWPQLPAKGSMIGIPVTSNPDLVVLEYDVTVVSEKFDLCPVETPKTSLDTEGKIHFDGYEYVKDVNAYSKNILSPTSPAEILSTGFIRSQRIAQVIFQPFQYNPVSGELRHYSRIQARFNFNPSHEVQASSEIVDEVGFESVFRESLLNYDQASSWRASPVPLTNPINQISDEDQPGIKLLIEEEGIYRLTYEDLQTAGVEPAILDTLNPSTFQLFNQGNEVAIIVSAGADGFDPEDSILFYGEGLDTIFTNTNIYWLKWDVEIGLRMQDIDGTPDGAGNIPSSFPSTLILEQDVGYLSSLPSGSENDRWYWDIISAASGPVTKNYTFSIDHLSSAPHSIIVRGLFKGYDADPFHHTLVRLNGNLIVDSSFWAARDEFNFEVAVPHTYLLEGENTLSVTAPLDHDISQDIFYINWFEIEYAASFIVTNDQLAFEQRDSGNFEFQVTGFTNDEILVFDVSDPLEPSLISGAFVTPENDEFTLAFQANLTGEHEFLSLSTNQIHSPADIILDTPSNLHSLTNSADYVIISHADFLSEAQLLADFRNGQGLTSMVVDVQDVYDEFSGGILDPQAIHDFLAYAYTNWAPPKPVYVLLFGDGNYDFKDNLRYGEKNYIPPYLADVDPWIGETAADNQFVTVAGEDLLADMHLGRLPVKSNIEASQVIYKIIYNETSSPIEIWNQHISFVADDADLAGDFAVISDSIANEYLPYPYTAEKIYYGITHPNASDVQSAMITAINQGRLAVNYIGHAAFWVWGDERLFSRFEISSLTNTQLFPLMVPMTCMDGYYIYPSTAELNYSSLGESIVASTPHGAIASWSPTGYGVASGHDFLNKGLFEALFTDDVIQLGPATTLAKLYLAANSTLHNDLLDTYILFGDPATQLNVPPAEVSISKTVSPTGVLDPGDQITYTLTFTNTGIATAHQVVVTDQLPTMLLNPVVNSSGVSVTQRPGSSFIWDVEDIDPGETGIITITATIDPEFFGSITNTASISTSARELDRLNNTSAPVTTLVQRPTSTLLGSFTATSYPGSILLQWETTSEVDLAGFNLYRADSPNGLLVKVNPNVIAPETPGSGVGNDYIFYDSDIVSGLTYYYWIELITNRDSYINGPISEFADYYLHAPLLKH